MRGPAMQIIFFSFFFLSHLLLTSRGTVWFRLCMLAVIDWSEWRSCTARLYPPSLPAVSDSQAKIQSKKKKKKPRAPMHDVIWVTSLTLQPRRNTQAQLMPTYLQPLPLHLTPAFRNSPRRCCSRPVLSPTSLLLSSHPLHSHSFTPHCFTLLQCLAPFDGCVKPVGAMMQRRRVMQRGRTYSANSLNVLSTLFLFSI